MHGHELLETAAWFQIITRKPWRTNPFGNNRAAVGLAAVSDRKTGKKSGVWQPQPINFHEFAGKTTETLHYGVC